MDVDAADVLVLNTDVTVVKFIKSHVFAGIGNILHIFDVPSLKHITRTEIFKHRRIHGIHENITKALVAINGNTEIAITEITYTDRLNVDVLVNWDLHDWIWDVAWFESNKDEIMTLTAHNVVTLWNWKTTCKLRTVYCPIKCLLYSGTINIADKLENCIFFSGTAFKQIILWSCATDSKNNGKVLHILSGHEGAVFSISYNSKINRISSTSDDRTIRIWQVKFDSNNCSARITDQWSSASVNLLFTIYGHLARVWKSMILNDARIISVSEDSQLRIWDKNGRALKQWETHQGASIWSLDCNEELNLIVTGGKDGGVSSWLLSDDNNYNSSKSSITSYLKLSKNSTFVPRRLVITRNNRIISIADNGSLYKLHGETLVTIFDDDELASYCLLEISLDRDYICLASISGVIVILKEDDDDVNVIFNDFICHGKIFSVHWLEGNYLITCSSNGVLNYWKTIHEKSHDEIKYRLQKVRTFVLPPCKERWLTSAAAINNEYIMAGDRDGSVHLYSIQLGSDSQMPCKTFHKIHGRLGVSNIWYIKESEQLCSIGRDGYIRYWTIQGDHLDHISADKLNVKWPVRVISTASHGLLVLGFNEVNFELWNIKERKEILKHYCGGGHRSWDFVITDDRIYFAYIREKSISDIIIPISHLVNSSYLEGFHISETNCAFYLTENILFSGGEDTTLRISELNKTDGTVKTKAVIRSHISSIRAIFCLPHQNYWFVISAGGRAQLKLWKISLTLKGEFKYIELVSYMLNNNYKNRRPWKNNNVRIELEPRFMDLHAFMDIDSENIIIAAACSDGILRLFLFDTKIHTLKQLEETGIHGNCILKILSIRWKNLTIVITMGTDGKALFWEISDIFSKNGLQLLKPVYTAILHQSGINSYDYKLLENGSLLLATGGDDTALSLSLFNQNNYLSLMQVQLLYQRSIPGAHHSQITGLKLFDKFIISSAIDQNILLWRWSQTGDNLINLERVASYKIVLPDIHGLIAHQKTENRFNVCVYGAGVEVLAITTDFKKT